MDCLVADGAGFIGSHLVDALIDREDRVTVIATFDAERPEVVFHLAAPL